MLKSRRGQPHEGVSYQSRRSNSAEKGAAIERLLDLTSSRNVLDVGCNAGMVARFVAHDRFVVGVDVRLALDGIDRPLDGVALGQMPIDLDCVATLPTFDAILCLSVHHQWTRARGDDYTRELIRGLASHAQRALVLQFAAIASKYGFEQSSHFVDNDIDTVVEYASNWLSETLPDWRHDHLGNIREHAKKEPYRPLFGLIPPDSLWKA